MNLSFYIARRYLFSKKSHNAINIISMISVCGVVLATVAMVCALSVFNGFDRLVAMMFGNLDPEIKITAVQGKVFDPSASEIMKVKEMSEIAFVGEVLQDNAMIRFQGRQELGVVKGVDSVYLHIATVEEALTDGRFALREDVVDHATLGIGLAFKLGARSGFLSPLEIYAPKRDVKVNPANPAASLEVAYAYISGRFRIDQAVYDDSYMIVPIELARSLFRYEKEVSALEIKLADGADVNGVKKRIRQLLGDSYRVMDRYEQQEDAFRMMQIEKAMTFLILCFILVIALFNLVGSLSMLMNEKEGDVQTLRNLGADNNLIKRIFLYEGWMISGFGVVIGIVIGLILCFLQIQFGLIRLGDSGAFVIDAYPVHVLFGDLVLIFVTVVSIGFLASWYPVRQLSKKWEKEK